MSIRPPGPATRGPEARILRGMHERPGGVPSEAWWSEKDGEWILGARDDAGRLHGLVRYWRPDGTLVSECPHLEGRPHGPATRFHETGEPSQTAHYDRGVLHGPRVWYASAGPTTEKMHAEGMSRDITRVELDYDQGTIRAFRYFDREGRPVSVDGKPLPARPPGVPDTALPNGTDWVDSRWSESGSPIGTSKRWNRDGLLLTEETRADGEVRCTTFHDNGGPRLSYTLRGEQLVGVAEARRPGGGLRRRASFSDAGHVNEDFDRSGALVRRSEIPAPAPAASHADTSELPAIDDTTTSLSPVDMARVIARGWGGDDDRDAAAARRARRLVRRIAGPSLAARLAALGLDRAPRIWTATRLDAVARALGDEPQVDPAALMSALIDAGSTGVALALRDPSRALALLRGRIHGHHLNLGHLGLDALPPALAGLLAVRTLDASYNRLRDVPVALAELFRLHRLDLSHNAIASLPRELAYLPELSSLYLAYNDLRAVPPTVFEFDQVRSLSLGDNALTELPDAIGDMTELRELWLNDNQLADLPRGLARARLRFLHLGNHGWSAPPAVVAELTSLEHLWIASSSLERLPPEICALPRLRNLIVWYSNLRAVPDELFTCTGLTELRIGHNPLPAGTLERLREALPGCSIY